MRDHFQVVKREYEKKENRYQNDQHRYCHQAFKTSTYEEFKDLPCQNHDPIEGTCQWVLAHTRYLRWYVRPSDDLLWISTDPGCGETALTKSLVDNELRNTDKHNICYFFFFKDNEEQDNLVTALCALLHQLFAHQPWLIRHAAPA